MASFLRPYRAARIKLAARHGLRGVRLTADLLHPWLRSSTPFGVKEQLPNVSQAPIFLATRTCRRKQHSATMPATGR
jgi:hypothetical protein